MKTEMRKIEYIRISKFVYRALWSTAKVEHFIYFFIDSRGYFEGRYGLRNPVAEEFGIDSIIKYGHPNRQLIRRGRDPRTACSMSFAFGGLDDYTRRAWPRVRVQDEAGSKLAMSAASFVRQCIFPIVRNILDLEALLNLLVSDQEPTIWMVTSPSARVAQIVAIGKELRISKDEIIGFLRPFERMIAIDLIGVRVDPDQTFDGHLDRYVGQLFSDLEHGLSE